MAKKGIPKKVVKPEPKVEPKAEPKVGIDPASGKSLEVCGTVKKKKFANVNE